MGTETYLDLLTHSCKELGVIAGTETLNGPIGEYCLDKLTMMVDGWNIRPSLVPWYITQTLPFTPGKQDYLIGSGVDPPDWNAPRPVKIEKDLAQIQLLSGAPPVNIPIVVLDATEWAGISIPELQITFPQAMYYVRDIVVGTNLAGDDWTAGTIKVWGIPTNVNNIVLTYWKALTVGALSDKVNAAPGYFRTMMLSLCSEIDSALGVEATPKTVRNAELARQDIGVINKPNMTAQINAPGCNQGTYLTRAQFESGQF